jgi:deazaflavin-dependent oxidoreductase (nitroreductase family)
MWSQLKRWLYRGGRPSALTRWVNGGVGALHAAGLGPAHWVTLAVPGRKSGRTISFPLVMTTLDGQRYLVSMLGNAAAWVRNVEANGGCAVLRRGGSERVRLELVATEQRARVLKAYLACAPGARPHIAADVDAPIARFEAIAADFPVFRVLPATRSH